MDTKIFTSADQELLLEIMRHRRDVRGRDFLPEAISDVALKQILYAASLAPSVGFSQPWEFVIIRDNDVKKHIYKSFQIENKKGEALFEGHRREMYASLKLEGILEAPVNIAVFYKHSEGPVLGQTTMEMMGEYSVVCAIQNMWLMARAMNIGIGWVSILDPDTVKKTLKAPDDRKLIAYLCVGHVKGFRPVPELEILKWEERKEHDTVVFHASYPMDLR